MGEKLYRPIINDGDHLVRSKDNEDRVRGVSQDENNRTTDIVEWEEVNIEDSTPESELESSSFNLQQRIEYLAAGAAFVYAGKKLYDNVLKPWWVNKATPWIQDKIEKISDKQPSQSIEDKTVESISVENSTELMNELDTQISEQLDQDFDNIQFDMNSDEAWQHGIRLIYHVFAAAYEIKVLSNTRIVDQIEDEEAKIENQARAEKLLAEKVSIKINDLLSGDNLNLSLSDQQQIFNLLGGGIKRNGEYVPVEPSKVSEAIDSIEQERHANDSEQKD